MSNARKLQTEIERCMKKVDEGVELFDEIWEKVYSAEQQNQKEKYEMDLKKEIKKLQRQRDQIKTWISSSEVKDKDPLIEARKLIESKMEQFKICEKETKTKTYSKEGLAREDKLDPEEEAKLNTTTWLSEYIEKFKSELEEKDFEIERLSAGKGKKQHKSQLEALQQHVANHKFHINKLEGIIRLVNNDRLDVDVVDPLKEDLDYYLESYQDEDYAQAYDEDYFYEALGLDDLDIVNVDHVTQLSDTKDEKSVKKSDDATSTSSRGSKDTRKSGKKSSISSVIPLTIGRARSKQEKADKAKKDAQEAEEKATPVKAARGTSTGSKTAVPAPPPSTATQPPGTSMAAILKRESEQQEKERQQKLLREQQAKAQAAEQQRLQLAAQQKQQQEALQRQQQEAAMKLKQQQQAQADALRQQQETELRHQQQKESAAAAAKQAELAAPQQMAPSQLQAPIGVPTGDPSDASVATANTAGSNTQASQLSAQLGGQAQQPTNAATIDILTAGLGGLGLGGPASSRPGAEGSALPVVGATGDNTRLLRPPSHVVSSALSESFAAVPNVGDHERSGSSSYVPQNPYNATPPQYPTQPSAIFEKPEVFEKLGTDALFFIFYYAQGSYQQYLAARELKKQSWRFHKQYMTWFQRHEEPQITTDEYEQGTYVYFDYETGWCTRIKQDFRFEYSFLEDSLQ